VVSESRKEKGRFNVLIERLEQQFEKRSSEFSKGR